MAELGSVGSERRWDRSADRTSLPQPHGIAPFEPTYGRLPYGDFLDIRPIRPHGLAEGARAWVRLVEDAGETSLQSPHAVAALFLDALPPGLLGEPVPPTFLPTIDFSVHFAPTTADSPNDWHYVTQDTVWANDKYCVEEAALYAADGHLIAQSRQTRRVRWD
ncbi:MAG TPA: hypothetical protein VFD59_18330 [Nocardioidaceae bacterium]|nr:hypothetical protein [Nocardioidaceae bacterium]